MIPVLPAAGITFRHCLPPHLLFLKEPKYFAGKYIGAKVRPIPWGKAPLILTV
jgi:hypothetical protein